MTKTYEVVTVTSVSIDIDKMCEMVKEAIEDTLLDYYEINAEDHPQLKLDLIKEISKRLLTTC